MTEDPDDTTIGGRIQLAMERAGIKTQAELADRLGKPRQLVNRWIRNPERPPGDESVDAIAEITGADPAWLKYGQRRSPWGSLTRDDAGTTNESGKAEAIVHALGDPEWVRRHAGVLSPADLAEFGYQIALKQRLPPEEMEKILRWRAELLGDA